MLCIHAIRIWLDSTVTWPQHATQLSKPKFTNSVVDMSVFDIYDIFSLKIMK